MLTTQTTVSTDFSIFGKAVNARFREMSKDELYTTDCDDNPITDSFFDKYLTAYPPGTNPVYRVRPLYSCKCCENFIRRLGGLVAIDGGKVRTVWEGLDLPEPFATVAAVMHRIVSTAPITGVFRSKERRYGREYNYDAKTNERHDHFWGDVADRHHAADPGAKIGERAAVYQVLKRGLTEIKLAHVDTVLELVGENGLYRGEEHKPALIGFRGLLHKYLLVAMFGPNKPATDLFVWEHLDDRNARFRNTVIGTLLTDMAEGMELDRAVRAFEAKVAPANYKRPTAVITQRMVDDALATINKLDLGGAISRRYARLSDVSVNDVLFVDNNARGKMKDGHGIADLLASAVKTTPPDLSRAVKIGADEFVRTVLPGAKTLDCFVENRHAGNFVSLTGADGPERLFKWDNNFAWSYDGDVADSVKQRVKAAGGKIDCKLRVSLSWFNYDDLDLHCHTPRGLRVYFGDKQGILDVDMNAGEAKSRTAVENLAFQRLEDGVYRVVVNQYQQRESIDVGFAIEIEYGGAIHQYRYDKALRTGQDVPCFDLVVKNRELAEIKASSALTGGSVSQDKWGIKTETLVPVVLAAYSPNHWSGNAVGAKHLIFALRGCVNPGSCRTIYNEFLRNDLTAHGKVFETLGSKTKAPYSDEQVSGVGFTAARGDTVTVVVDGRRAYTLTF